MHFFQSDMLDKMVLLPKFVPEKYEVRYSVSQLFETGIEVTQWFVIRNGNTMIYKEEKKKHE